MKIDRVGDAANQKDSLHPKIPRQTRNGSKKRVREVIVRDGEMIRSAVTVDPRQATSRKKEAPVT